MNVNSLGHTAGNSCVKAGICPIFPLKPPDALLPPTEAALTFDSLMSFAGGRAFFAAQEGGFLHTLTSPSGEKGQITKRTKERQRPFQENKFLGCHLVSIHLVLHFTQCLVGLCFFFFFLICIKLHFIHT